MIPCEPSKTPQNDNHWTTVYGWSRLSSKTSKLWRWTRPDGTSGL